MSLIKDFDEILSVNSTQALLPGNNKTIVIH